MISSSNYFEYQLGGRSVLFDRAIASLAPYASGKRSAPVKQFAARSVEDGHQKPGPQLPEIQATGWIGEGMTTVSVWRQGAGFVIDIPSAGRFWTALDGCMVCHLALAPQADLSFLTEALLGPPLVLALALQDVWCLHASLVSFGDQIIAFLGQSGAGKSTLAAFLDDQPGCNRLGDDILPVGWEVAALQACPHFPQLKLPTNQQPAIGYPERLPLLALYILDEAADISLQALSSSQATLALVSHTVSARLFDRGLLQRHLEFCGLAAQHTRLCRLAYPRQMGQLPRVWTALQADIAVWAA